MGAGKIDHQPPLYPDKGAKVEKDNLHSFRD